MLACFWRKSWHKYPNPRNLEGRRSEMKPLAEIRDLRPWYGRENATMAAFFTAILASHTSKTSSYLLDDSFAMYIPAETWNASRSASRLGFLFSSCRVGFFSSFLLYFHFVFRLYSRAELIQREMRDINVMMVTNYVKVSPFFSIIIFYIFYMMLN